VPIEIFNNQILFNWEEEGVASKVFLDTGSPKTISEQKTWNFLGREHKLSNSFYGTSFDKLATQVGTQFEVLLGLDVLQYYYFEIHWHQKILKISENFPKIELEPKMDFFQKSISYTTLIQFGLEVGETQHYTFIIDTGAPISYLKSKILVKISNNKYKKKDFSPFWTEPWETEIYHVPLKIGNISFVAEFGVLPKKLENQFLSTHDGILGSDLFRNFKSVGFDLLHGSLCFHVLSG